MKTITDLKQEMESIPEILAENKKDLDEVRYRREEKKAKKKIQFLRTILLYLENNPSEQFVEKQLADTKKHIKHIDENYTHWTPPPGKVIKNHKNIYHSENGYNKLLNQRRNLLYILS